MRLKKREKITGRKPIFSLFLKGIFYFCKECLSKIGGTGNIKDNEH